MKTEAHCPNCNAPFSFWRLAISNPFALYCMSCGWRIDIVRAKIFMWLMLAGMLLITFSLAQFIIPRDYTRLLILAILWVAGIAVLDIIVSLMMVNWAQLSKPEETGGEDDAE